MIKSLLAGTAALCLIASAALAQQAFDSSTSRTTTTTVTQPVVPPVESSTTTTQQKAYGPNGTYERSTTTTTAPAPLAATDPGAFDPTRTTRTSRYHEEKSVNPNGQVVEKSSQSEVTSPNGRTVSTSQTTTRTDQQ